VSRLDLSLGFATKVRACKDVGQEWSLGVTFHAHRGVGECEGMNPHSKVGSHFGSWSFDGLSNIQRAISGVITHWIEEKSSYHWKALEM
jgi:hypothetical protein